MAEHEHEGAIRFGDDVVPIDGEAIIQYTMSTLRRAQEPDDSVYLHALHPPRPVRPHSAA